MYNRGMSEQITEGPIWDIKYGDNPSTGIYEFIGHRIELPNRDVFFSEQYANDAHFSWSTGMSLADSIHIVPDVGIKQCILIVNDDKPHYTRSLSRLKEKIGRYTGSSWFIYARNGDTYAHIDSNDDRSNSQQFVYETAQPDMYRIQMLMEFSGTLQVARHAFALLQIAEVTDGD